MQIGRVVGMATATVKHRSMQGVRLLVVQPLMADGERADGDPILVVDELGAAAGSDVLLTSDGVLVQTMLKDEKTPVRWSVMGLVDSAIR